MSSVPLTATHAAWPAVLEGVDEVLRSCTYPTRQLTIITDLRKSGLGARRRQRSAGAGASRASACGSSTSARRGRQRLARRRSSPLDRTILAGAASRLGGGDPQRLAAHAHRQPRRSSASTTSRPRWCCRRSRLIRRSRVPLSVPFPGPGRTSSRSSSRTTSCRATITRWAAVPVKDSLLIRLVDGEPSSEPFGSEVDYLAAPLSIGIGAAEAWRVEVVPEQDFLSPRLDPADVLVLANVAAPTLEQAERLGSLVKRGHGPDDLHRARSSTSASTTTCSTATNDRVLPFPVEEPGRREHSRAVRRAAASLAAREAAGAEAVGARARRRSARS